MKNSYTEPDFRFLPVMQTDIIATSIRAIGDQDCEYADWAIIF